MLAVAEFGAAIAASEAAVAAAAVMVFVDSSVKTDVQLSKAFGSLVDLTTIEAAAAIEAVLLGNQLLEFVYLAVHTFLLVGLESRLNNRRFVSHPVDHTVKPTDLDSHPSNQTAVIVVTVATSS